MRLRTYVLLFCSAALLADAPARVNPRAAALIEAASIHVIDASNGQVLLTKNGSVRREVASLQKLLTAMVVIEAGNLDKPVTITAADANCLPTKLPNAVGGTYTRRQLLEVMLIYSPNDVARALARDNAGSEAAFAAKMTAMARRLGAKNSVFKNSAGFSAPGQYSTAEDMARIARAALTNPFMRRAMQTKSVTWRDRNGRAHVFQNSNRLLHRHDDCVGMKVGYTGKAGHCAISVWQGKRRIIAVTLAGKGKASWLESGIVFRLMRDGLL
ncbi:MAG: D-alanyl-D-alanine carboxypeptidase family protein [Chthoniobacterales bacterium]